jgi:hypothetical protein
MSAEMPRPLSMREENFCIYFLTAATATHAVVMANYSKVNPQRQACRLLERPEIVDRINELKKQRNEQLMFSAVDMLQRLSALANTALMNKDYNTSYRCLDRILTHVTDATLRQRVPDEEAAPGIDQEAVEREAVDNVVGLMASLTKAKKRAKVTT